MPASGPTQTTALHPPEEETWSARPHLARTIRLLVVAVPLVGSVLFGFAAAAHFPPSRLGVNRWLWWIGIALVATVVLRVLDRLAQKLAPIALLFRLSLIFPDQAPSRFKMAMRSTSARSLQRTLDERRRAGELNSDDEYAAEMLRLIGVLSDHDRRTRGHSERVRAYSSLIADELGLAPRDKAKLHWAALLHDMGKLDVPAEILNKPGRPDDDEWAVLAGHPRHGADRVAPLAAWLGDWVHAVGHHHERWDGAGYPDGLAGTDIPLSARIVAVADAYDVMTSVRSYKAATPAEVARQEVADGAGSQFDPAVVRAFMAISIGRLRATAGPLAWLASLSGLRPEAFGGLSSGAASGVAAAAAAVIGVVGLGGGIGDVAADPAATPLAFTGPTTTTTGLTPAPRPVGSPTVVTDEDEAATVVIGFTTADAATVTIATPPRNGQATITDTSHTGRRTDVTLRYQPDPDVSGRDDLELSACGPADCFIVPVPVTIRAVNDPPTGSVTGATVSEGGTLRLTLDDDGDGHRIDARDVDGDRLTITAITTDGTGEAVSSDGRSIWYTHGGGESATATVSFSLTDGTVATPIVATLDVTPVDDPPRAAGDAAFTRRDVPISIQPNDLLANDADVDSAALRVTHVIAGANGTARFDGSVITYTPATGFTGTDQFDYVITDGTSTARATVTVTVAPPATAPVARPDTVTVAENGTTTVDVRANDASGDITGLIVTAIGTPTHGVAQPINGSVVYTHDGSESLTDRFTYEVTNGAGLRASSTVAVTIVPVNDPPVLTPATFSIPEDAPAGTLVGTASATDPDSTTLAFSLVSGDPAGLFTVAGDGRIRLSSGAALDHETTATHFLELEVSDGRATDRQTITISVRDRNDPPGDAVSSLTLAEGATVTTTDLRSLHTDPDGDPLTVVLTSSPGNGAAVVNGNGTITYTHDGGETTTDTIGYEVTDPGGATGSGSISVAISAVNDRPVITGAPSPQSVLENMAAGTSVAIMTGTDPEGSPLTWSITGGNGAGRFSIGAGTGALVTTAPLDRESTPSYTLTIRASDGALADTTTLVVDVGDVNEAPTISGASFSVHEDAANATVVGSLTASDPEGGPLTYTIVAGDPAGVFSASGGTVTVVDNATLDYDTTTSYSLTVKVDDDDLPAPNSDTATVTIAVDSRTTLAAGYGALAPNEVLFDERIGLPDEFIELINTSAAPIDLDGWTFADGDVVNGLVDPAATRFAHTVTGPTVLGAGERMVLWVGAAPPAIPDNTAPGADLQLHAGYLAPALSAVADDLWVFDDAGALAAYMTWGDDAALGAEINPRPPAAWGLWDTTEEVSLASTAPGQSVSLSPDVGAARMSACWEPTTSGDALARCAAALGTADSDGAIGRTSSVGATNDPSGGTAPNLVISEYSTDQAYAPGNFIELYNGTAGTVDLSSFELHIFDTAIAPIETVPIVTGDTVLVPGDHYLFGQDVHPISASADDVFSTDLGPATGIGLWDGTGYVDAVGNRERTHGGSYGAAGLLEGTGLPPLIQESGFDQSYERRHGAGAGNCEDSDDNSLDFIRNMAPGTVNPQSSTDPLVLCGTPPPPPPATGHLVISELRTDGPNGADDEYIEIFNPTGAAIDLGDYEVREEGGSVELDLGPFLLLPGQRYLVVGDDYVGPRDAVYTGGGIPNGGAAELWNATLGVSVDYLELDTGPGSPALPRLDGRLDHAYVRIHGGCTDTDSATDFVHQMYGSPATRLDPPTPCP